MMIACGDFVIPGDKMPPNNAEAEVAYAIFIDMIENGWLTVSSESLVDGKTRIRWELLKEQVAVKPKYNARTNWYECGNCHYSMTSGMHCRSELIPATKVRYCANCGFPINWECR